MMSGGPLPHANMLRCIDLLGNSVGKLLQATIQEAPNHQKY
jgi:hypothetical protein